MDYPFDPVITPIMTGAARGDRAILPMLREALEHVVAFSQDSKTMIAQAAVDYAHLPDTERAQAMMRLVVPLSRLDDLVVAAMQMPDASLKPVLKALSTRFSHEGIRNSLALVRATMPGAQPAGVRDLALPSNDQIEGRSGLAKLVNEGDRSGVMDALTEASIGDLLAGIVAAIRRDEGDLCQMFMNACFRFPEVEVLFVVRAWQIDPDRDLRKVAALALGRPGEMGEAPNERVVAILHRLMTDPEPAVIAAALSALAWRTARSFTSTDLEVMRSACESHPSSLVRETYSDIFYSPLVGHDPASGALETWCRMARDAEQRIRYAACSRLIVCFAGRPRHVLNQICTVLNEAKADTSADVRFIALGGLSQFGHANVEQVARELSELADRLGGADLNERTGDEDDGLGLVTEMICRPNRLYVSPLERIVASFRAADLDCDEFDTLLETCRRAPRGHFLGRLLRM